MAALSTSFPPAIFFRNSDRVTIRSYSRLTATGSTSADVEQLQLQQPSGIFSKAVFLQSLKINSKPVSFFGSVLNLPIFILHSTIIRALQVKTKYGSGLSKRHVISGNNLQTTAPCVVSSSKPALFIAASIGPSTDTSLNSKFFYRPVLPPSSQAYPSMLDS